MSAASPAAPQDASAATGPTPNTGAKEQVSLAVKDGSLTGRILADLTGEPIAQAVVIARCGSNGEAEYTTRTDENGIYQFTAITATPCLVEAAKYLSSPDTRLEEFDRVQATKSARSARASGQPKDAATAYAEQREAERTRSPEAQLQERQAKYSAVNKANPDLQSFAARTLKNLTPSQGGSTELVQDIRLAPAKTSIGEFARAIVGLEQSGASSAQSTQNYFADLWISLPMPFFTSKSKLSPSPNDFNFGPRNRIWGDFRITSAPQQISASVGDFAIGFADQIANVQVNKVAQATEFMIGEENRLSGWGLTEQRFLSFDHSTRQRFALYFTAGFGRVTPLNPKDNVQLFNNPTLGTEPAFDQQIANLGLTSQLAGKRFVAFASRDRFKFYKEYYAGLRMKTFYYDKDTDEPLGRFPASLEAVIGQNETVTGGRLHRPVVRLEGFFPLPYDSVKYLYLFGTADLIVGGQKGGDAIILQSADNPPPVPDPSILLIQTPQLDRDHYRIGVGIDFMQLVKAIQDRNKNKPDVK